MITADLLLDTIADHNLLPNDYAEAAAIKEMINHMILSWQKGSTGGSSGSSDEENIIGSSDCE